MEGPDRKFRKAPTRERPHESEQLDAMIVIPSMNEGEKIIDTIYSAVQQIAAPGSSIAHGITVVINNRPNADTAITHSNLRTYLLLQALEHRFPISLRGNKHFKEKVAAIQSSRVPIHVIDSFSDGFAHPESNVGRARRIGTEHALSHVKPDGFIVSTDADTVLDRGVIFSAKQMFAANEPIVGTRLHMVAHLHGTNEDEKRASVAASESWGLSRFVDTDEANIESEFVWMAGGGSVFRAKQYKELSEKGKGYMDIPGHEDTMLGSSFADEGYVIRDMSKDLHGLRASTRQRFSERASIGYGRTMLGYDLRNTPFPDVRVESPAYMLNKNAFFKAVENIYYEDLIEKYGKHPELPVNDLYNVFSNRSVGDPFVEEFIVETKDLAVARLQTICKDFSLSDVDTKLLVSIFRRWKPNQEMSTGHHDFIETGKKIFESMYPKITVAEFFEYVKGECIVANAAHAEHPAVIELVRLFPDTIWDYERFEQRAEECLKAMGLDLIDPQQAMFTKTAVLNAYKEVMEGIDNLVRKFQLDADTSVLEKSDDEKDEAKLRVLRAIEVPLPIVQRLFVYTTLWQQAEAIASVRNALLYDISDDLAKKLELQAQIKSIEAKAFYQQVLKRDIEEFQSRRGEILDETEAALDALDAARGSGTRVV